ncbi:MAG: hypothetical protein ACFFER_05500 [Candidatus Thorarchaeota archaeon]
MAVQRDATVIDAKGIIDALNQVNVSAFLDIWGPEEVIQCREFSSLIIRLLDLAKGAFEYLLQLLLWKYFGWHEL